MSTATLTLTEFLLARIAEDEAAASACGCDPADDSPVRWKYDRANPAALHQFGDDQPDGVLVRAWQLRKPVQFGDWIIATHWEEDGEHIARHDPARVLAECEAKRALVEDHDSYHECTGPGSVNGPGSADDDEFEPCNVLRHLASAYKDHSDYHEEWKP